jgi:hypothetical protein
MTLSIRGGIVLMKANSIEFTLGFYGVQRVRNPNFQLHSKQFISFEI